MAKKMYLGVDNLARKIKKQYLGVDNKARKVKKGYIGIGSVARPFMSGEPAYFGKITPLSVARSGLAATTVGNYALFAGGAVGYFGTSDASATGFATVDAYSANLTKTTAPSMGVKRSGLTATTVGDYALFAGGQYNSGSSTYYNYAVDVYDNTLAKMSLLSLGYTSVDTSTSPPTSTFHVCAGPGMSSTTIADVALFSRGAYCSSNNVMDNNIYSVTSTLVSSRLGASFSRYEASATTAGTHAVFYGGSSASNEATVINADLTSTTATIGSNSYKLYNNTATSVGDFAIFAGGEGSTYTSSSAKCSYVWALNASLVASTVSNLSTSKARLSATTVGDLAIFAGGYSSSRASTAASDTSDIIDIYDTNLVKTSALSLSVKRGELAATTIGDYVLFAGGYDLSNGAAVDAVEAIVV